MTDTSDHKKKEGGSQNKQPPSFFILFWLGLHSIYLSKHGIGVSISHSGNDKYDHLSKETILRIFFENIVIGFKGFKPIKFVSGKLIELHTVDNNVVLKFKKH